MTKPSTSHRLQVFLENPTLAWRQQTQQTTCAWWTWEINLGLMVLLHEPWSTWLALAKITSWNTYKIEKWTNQIVLDLFPKCSPTKPLWNSQFQGTVAIACTALMSSLRDIPISSTEKGDVFFWKTKRPRENKKFRSYPLVSLSNSSFSNLAY